MNRHMFYDQYNRASQSQKDVENPQSEETRVRTIHDWFWFYAWLDEKVREVMQTKYFFYFFFAKAI